MEYNLLIKAALQGCTNLQLHGGFSNPNNTYRIKVKCKRCQEGNVIEMSLGHVPTSPSTSRKTNSSKSPVHFDGQCTMKNCAQMIWAQMIPGCGAPYARNSKVEYKEIMKFKFGGAKPVGFIFGGGWEFESLHRLDTYKGYTLDDYVQKGKNPSEEQSDTTTFLTFGCKKNCSHR